MTDEIKQLTLFTEDDENIVAVNVDEFGDVENEEIFEENKNRLVMDVDFDAGLGDDMMKVIANSLFNLTIEEASYNAYEIINLLNGDDYEDKALEFVREWYDSYTDDWDELLSWFDDPLDLVKATKFGEVNLNDEYIYFDGYGNLTTTNMSAVEIVETECANDFLNNQL